jgi:hypothetical protein
MNLGATILGMTAFIITTLSITILDITAFSITILTITMKYEIQHEDFK